MRDHHAVLPHQQSRVFARTHTTSSTPTHHRSGSVEFLCLVNGDFVRWRSRTWSPRGLKKSAEPIRSSISLCITGSIRHRFAATNTTPGLLGSSFFVECCITFTCSVGWLWGAYEHDHVDHRRLELEPGQEKEWFILGKNNNENNVQNEICWLWLSRKSHKYMRVLFQTELFEVWTRNYRKCAKIGRRSGGSSMNESKLSLGDGWDEREVLNWKRLCFCRDDSQLNFVCGGIIFIQIVFWAF